MKLRVLITTVAIALLSLTAQAATIVIPAAGSGAGLNGSQWQSEVTVHNAAPRAATISLSFHFGTTVFGPVELTVMPRQTVSIDDIARTRFNLEAGTGAVVIEAEDRDARSLAITSRTFNTSPEGEYGQDIPAINIMHAATADEIAALTGPSDAAGNRFNFGLYAVEATTIRWAVLRSDGTVAGSTEIAYAAGQHQQYTNGVPTVFGVALQDNDTVHARVVSGSALVYGSIVNATGDPSYIPGIRVRDDIVIQFLGVDLNENGVVDLFDENGDGVLDTPIQVKTSLFPTYFQVFALGEFGEAVELEIVSSTANAALLDSNTVRIIATGDLLGKPGELVMRATSGDSSTLLHIPMIFY
ncbi:MAG TPA: hypothetical protein VF701_22035 [Thermoanaerobaculia bacterium]